MSPTAVQAKMPNWGAAFVAISIVIGMIFNSTTYGITAGILMLLLVAFEYSNGPVVA